MQSTDDMHAMEEGRFDKMIGKCKNWANRHKNSPRSKFFVLYFAWFLCLLSFRPAIEMETPLLVIPEDSSQYVSLLSQPVQKQSHYLEVCVETMIKFAKENEYECLAAIHVGIPLKILLLEGKIYFNPKIMKQGSDISKAYETSAFFPEREALEVTRFLPITVEFLNTNFSLHQATFNGVSAHCVLHIINQFEGRNIYD